MIILRRQKRMNFNIEKFDSISQLEVALKRPLNEAWKNCTPASDRMDSHWNGVDTFEQAFSLFKYGDSDLAKKVSRIKVPNFSNDLPKRQRINGMVGGRVVVPRYLANIPTCRTRVKKVPAQSKMLTIVYNSGVNCSTSTDTIITVSKKIVDLINSLTIAGYTCRLYLLIITEKLGKVKVFKYLVKDFNTEFNLARTSFILAHPAMLRGIWFKYMEHSTGDMNGFEYGYGRPYYPSKKELLSRKIIEQTDVYTDFQELRSMKNASEIIK